MTEQVSRNREYDAYLELCKEGIIPSLPCGHPEKRILESYKGIKILWDEDNDTRVYWAIDKIIELIRNDTDYINSILWIGERKGYLTISINNSQDGELLYEYLEEFHAEGSCLSLPNDWWSVDIIFPNGQYDYRKLFDEEEQQLIPSRIITSSMRYEVCKRQKWKCNNCHINLKFHRTSEWEGMLAHIDHIHPYADALTYQNGHQNINESCNLQALCEKCNLTKRKTKN